MKRMLMLFLVGVSFASPVLAADVGDIQTATDGVKKNLECSLMAAREVPSTATVPANQKHVAPATAVGLEVANK